MTAEEIREGDIVEIDYITDYTKEHINEGKALVIWKGFNNQPLVRKLDTKRTIWDCYEHIAKVVGHIDIEGYMDKALEQENSTAKTGSRQVVIEMPEDVYEEIMIHNRELRESGKSAYYLEGLIQNGTPLPKGHGDMIDVGELLASEKPRGISDDLWKESHIYKLLSSATPVIKADTEEQEMKNTKKNTKKKEGIEL